MIVINRLMDELTAISIEYNNGESTKKELKSKLDLFIGQIEKVELNFSEQPLDVLPERVQASFNQLLFIARYKAIESIKELQEASTKQSYNAKLRQVLGNRLYFKNLYRTMRINSAGYIARNQLQYYSPNMNIFTLGGNENE